MAQLSDADRQKVRGGLAGWWSDVWEVIALSTAELKAAVDATDTWIDDNQTLYNQALPQAARDNLTQDQKTLLFCAVALARVGISWLGRMFREVN